MSEPDTDTPSTDEDGIDRRGFLECMAWAGTGVLWTLAARRAAGHRPRQGARRRAGLGALHLRPDQRQPHRLRQARQPRCAGDAPRGDRPDQRAAGEARLHDPHRRHQPPLEARGVRRCRRSSSGRPACRCSTCPASTTCSTTGKARPTSSATARARTGAGWYSFDHKGVHFIGLVNVVNLKAGGLGNLGAEQLDWLRERRRRPVVQHADRRLRAHPALDRLPGVGLGHRRQRPGADLPQALRLGDGAQRPHPPGDAEGRGQRHLPHRALDRLPAAGARARRRRPGPMKVPAGDLRQVSRHRHRRLRAQRRAARRRRPAARGLIGAIKPTTRFPKEIRLESMFSTRSAVRPVLPRSSGGGIGASGAADVAASHPSVTVAIDNFTFSPERDHRRAWHHGDLGER